MIMNNRESDNHLTITISTRFDRETAGVLREAARERGIGVTTLIRMWTLDRLRRINKPNRQEASPSPATVRAKREAGRRRGR